MNEAAPAWTTGDAEAPAGEKDMGGWTMRVYTPEQQSRLHVDEEGTPEGSLVESQEAPGSVAPERSEKAIGDAAKAIADDEASQRRLFMFLGLLVAVAIAVLALGVGAARHRARRQALELGAVYGQAMGKASVVPAAQTSEDQL